MYIAEPATFDDLVYHVLSHAYEIKVDDALAFKIYTMQRHFAIIPSVPSISVGEYVIFEPFGDGTFSLENGKKIHHSKVSEIRNNMYRVTDVYHGPKLSSKAEIIEFEIDNTLEIQPNITKIFKLRESYSFYKSGLMAL